MNHDSYDDAYLRAILKDVRNIAVLGASANSARPSYEVMHYLAEHGYKVFPINPGQAGKQVAGLTFYARLADVPEPIDMVDIFRAPENLPDILQEVLNLKVRPKVFWAQLEVRDDAVAAEAEAAGLKVVMDRCPKIEYPRLLGAES
ncbi:CoA-binding protein [Xanthobacter sp. TB0139]|uniref:CoA-binding protein n=1 Tax=Xanthobacter sp. TB0139 TaxID=3459178 RepID=UPI00403A6EFE